MILLDTHVLLYDAAMPRRLSRAARNALESGEAEGKLACADVSLWEIAMLAWRGRLDLPSALDTYLNTLLAARGVAVIPFSPEVAAHYATALPPNHLDPADRAIAATAVAHGGMLVTRDHALRAALGARARW